MLTRYLPISELKLNHPPYSLQIFHRRRPIPNLKTYRKVRLNMELCLITSQKPVDLNSSSLLLERQALDDTQGLADQRAKGGEVGCPRGI